LFDYYHHSFTALSSVVNEVFHCLNLRAVDSQTFVFPKPPRRFGVTVICLLTLNMSTTDSTKRKAPPGPQLARAVFDLEGTSDEEEVDFCRLKTSPKKKPKTQQESKDDSDDDDSLEIMPPASQHGVIDLSMDDPVVADKHPLTNQTNKSQRPKASNSLPKRPPAAATTASSAKATTQSQSSTTDRKCYSSRYSLSDDSDDSSDEDMLLARRTTPRQTVKDRQQRPRRKELDQAAKRRQDEKAVRERQKQQEKAARERQKQQEKAAQERQKQQEKAARERQKQQEKKKKQEERAAQERLKQQEKEERQRLNQAHGQKKGKYKHEEIAILMDPKLHDNDPLELVAKLKDDFLVHPFPSMLSMAPAAIQFVRKEYLKGGAKDAVACLEANDQNGYEHIHQIMLIVEAQVFIPLLQRDDHDMDDDYPKLESWLASVQSEWRRVWKMPLYEEPRLLLMLRDLPNALDTMWNQHRGRGKKDEPSLPRQNELEDAIRWLLVQFQVECMLCPNAESIKLTLHNMTRALSSKPYVTQTSELECINKIKAGPGLHSGDPVDKARDIWLRQLQQIPRLSQSMAENVVQQYPTCQSLWQKYQELLQNDNEEEGRENCACLLANILNGGRTSQQKLSEAIFYIMTSNDPNQMIL
jgi:hypothetical protein